MRAAAAALLDRIDGSAHRGALAAGGATTALLAGGVDRPYPAGHRDLLERIAAEGTVAAEVPCGSSPTKWRFLARNRLIAGASHVPALRRAAARTLAGGDDATLDDGAPAVVCDAVDALLGDDSAA